MSPVTRKRRVLAVINHKGGSTKTTTSVNLAAALVSRGRRVRLIDVDPQAGSTTHWLPPVDMPEDSQGLLDVYNRVRTMDEATTHTSVENLYLVPSFQSLRSIERSRPPGCELVLQTTLQRSEAPVDYDILDCPHTLDVLAVAAVAAADALIIPVQASGLDVAGMSELLEMTEKVKDWMNPGVVIGAIVVGRVKPNARFDRNLVADFTATYPDAIVCSVADSVRMREATQHNLPINMTEPGGPCTRDFAELATRFDAYDFEAVAA